MTDYSPERKRLFHEAQIMRETAIAAVLEERPDLRKFLHAIEDDLETMFIIAFDLGVQIAVRDLDLAKATQRDQDPLETETIDELEAHLRGEHEPHAPIH
jgi:hypothetical protein